MLRAQVRCPPPPDKSTRSGAMIIDFHGLEMTMGSPRPVQPRHAHFASDVHDDTHVAGQQSNEDDYDPDELVVIRLSRILVSQSIVAQRKATGVLSFDAVLPDVTGENEPVPSVGFGDRAVVRRMRIAIRHPTTTMTRQPMKKTAITVQLPSISAVLSKPLIDGLQFFADDSSQLAARLLGTVGPRVTQSSDGRDPSLIGSRFFARYGSRSASISFTDTSPNAGDSKSETVVKLDIAQGMYITDIRVMTTDSC
jgi:autophagy-related protein 2